MIKTKPMTKNFWTTLISALAVLAPMTIAEPWNELNRPERLVLQFKSRLSDLPSSGRSRITPWADSYWQDNLGSISYRWRQFDDEIQEIKAKLNQIKEAYHDSRTLREEDYYRNKYNTLMDGPYARIKRAQFKYPLHSFDELARMTEDELDQLSPSNLRSEKEYSRYGNALHL
jgi:hypothetical protein